MTRCGAAREANAVTALSVGAAVSMVTLSPALAGLEPNALPAVAVIECAPSASAEVVTDQFPDASAMPVPTDTLSERTVIAAFAAAVPVNVGVLTFVML